MSRGSRGQSSRRRTYAIAGVVVIGGLVLLGVFRLASARQHLLLSRSDLTAARQALAGGDRAGGGADLDAADAELRLARAQADAFPLGQAGPIPLLGSPTKAARGAAASGADAVAAGRIMLGALASFPIGSKDGFDGHNLATMRTAALKATAAVAQARVQLTAAERQLAGPSSAFLPPIADPARAMRAEVQRAITSADGAARGLTLLSQMTDPNADLRILLLSQDSLELRPTGGYIGSVGILHFNHGTVALEDYKASEELPAPQPPLTPPADLAPVLPAWWGVSNANWWPDFPKSASTAAELYKRQGGGPVDGVLALTEFTTQRLLSVLGPLKLPDYAVPVSADGFDQRVVYEVELKRPLDTPRKKFLTELSQALFNRLSHLQSGELPMVAKALDTSVAAGDVQLWFSDPSRQARLAGSVISGALPHTSSDFLMLTDANITASKANESLTKHATYKVQQRADGRLVAHLSVEVRDDGAASSVNPYYNGLLRVYVPSGSQLLGNKAGQGADGPAVDAPYDVFAQDLNVQPMGSQTVTFDYVLPAGIDPGGSYTLDWVRQVGTSADSLSAAVGGRSLDVPSASRVGLLHVSLQQKGLVGWLRRRWIVHEVGL